jgi:carbon storage regulator
MLILTRKPCESIRIGEEVTVVVLEIRGTQVRLGVQAPKDIPVHREEVAERSNRERSQRR